MRNLLALAAAALITFVVLGWFLGWYQVQSTSTSSGREYKIDVNSPKITEDLNKGKETVRNWLNQKGGESNPGDRQQVRPGETPVPGGVPATLVTTPDGTIVYPGAPAP